MSITVEVSRSTCDYNCNLYILSSSVSATCRLAHALAMRMPLDSVVTQKEVQTSATLLRNARPSVEAPARVLLDMGELDTRLYQSSLVGFSTCT